MNTAFLAFVYSDRVNDISGRHRNFAISQVNYALGTNPANRSFVCGFGNNPPVRPHHRGAHGSWNNRIDNPSESRHVLFGAFVRGPGASDNYADSRSDYVANEVACDYNAAFTGALAKMYSLFGGYTSPDFPVAETPDAQFFVETSVNMSGSNFTEIRALLNNRSASCAAKHRFALPLFFNLTGLYAAGGTASNVTVTTKMLDGGSISPLTEWDAATRIYYVELRHDRVNIVPGGSTSYRREAQFRISVPTALGAAA